MALQPEPVRAGFLGDAPVREGVDVLYDESWLEHQEGRHGAALAGLDRVLEVVPSHERARFARGLCLLALQNPADAERELNKYLSLVAHRRINTCDALYFRAMALSQMSWEQKALADLDVAIASKPGCVGGCACGMSCRAADAVLARFALLLDLRIEAEYSCASDTCALADASAEFDTQGAPAEPPSAMPACSFDGPHWSVPMQQLPEALERCSLAGRVPLFVDDSLDRCVDCFFLYAPSTIVEMKRLVVQLRTAELTLGAALEQLRQQLVHAMRHGHCLVLRLGTSAPDFAKLTSDEHFPRCLLESATPVPVGENLVGHALASVLRPEDTRTGVFVVAAGFRVVLTCNFGPDKYAHYLAHSLPSWSRVQSICVATQSSAPGGHADAKLAGALTLSAADKAKARQLEVDRMTLFLQS
jgi:tetratricopeptide (TPR) repeat protein